MGLSSEVRMLVLPNHKVKDIIKLSSCDNLLMDELVSLIVNHIIARLNAMVQIQVVKQQFLSNHKVS